MTLRPQAMHGVGAIENGQIPIQRQALVGRTPNVVHREISETGIIGIHYSILVTIHRSTQRSAMSLSREMLNQREERSFTVVERDVVNVVKHSRISHSTELGVYVATANDNRKVRVLLLDRLCDEERTIEIAGKWDG